MTEPVEPTPAEPTEPTPVDDTASDDTFDPRARESMRKLRSENHSLRTRLRTIETDHERAVTQLAAAQRREIERIAGTVLVDPADVWRVDPDTSQAFIDAEFHEVVGDNVVEAAKELIRQKPHLAKPPSGPPPSNRPVESLRRGASPDTPPPPAPTWADAIRTHPPHR